MPRLPDSLDVLRQRDFRLFFLGQSASLLGDGMVNVALAFAVIELGGSASDIGLVFACRTLPLVACLLVGGVVADRTSRRAVMVAADLTCVASQGVLAALLIAGAADIWTVALLAGITGGATGFFNPASVGLVPTIVPPEDLQRANGLRATAMASGEIAGPLVAGLLVVTSGPGWALAIDAATFAVSAAFLSRLSVPERIARETASFLSELRDGWAAFRSRTWVWTFVASAAAGNMLWGAWSVLGPVVADRDLGGAAVWGTILAAMGVGGLAGALLAIRANPRRPMVVAILMVPVFAVPLALLAAGAPAPVLVVGALASGGAMMLGNTLWESTLQRHIPGESLSRVSAYDWFGSLAFRPLGLAIWGPVAAAVGISASLWAAFALLAATGLALLAVPDIRRLPAIPEAAPYASPTSSAGTSPQSVSSR
jgi:predicted MFS family arabinose efflux permease